MLAISQVPPYIATMPKKLPLSEQVRRAIDAAGVTRYRIAKETDVSEATLSRFVRGESGLSLAALDRLAEYLGLEIFPTAAAEGVTRVFPTL